MEIDYRDKNGKYKFSLHSVLAKAFFSSLMDYEGWRTVNSNKLQYVSQKTLGVQMFIQGTVVFECLFRYGDYINIKK